MYTAVCCRLLRRAMLLALGVALLCAGFAGAPAARADDQAPIDESKLDQQQLNVVKTRFAQLDANHDGKVSKQEFSEPSFDRMDLNHDGFITLEEAIRVLVPLAKPAQPAAQPNQPAQSSEENVKAIFKFKDKNGDGKLTPEEVNNPEQFKQLDANHDGVVTLDEALALYAGKPANNGGNPAQPANDPRVTETFNKLDKDGNGKLTAEEFPEPDRFKQMDANGDGFVTLAEAQAFFAKQNGGGQPANNNGAQPAQPNNDEQNFNKLDKDGDGKLTQQEAKMLIYEFNWMDANKDGVITLAEYQTAKHWQPPIGPDVSFTPLMDLGKGQYKGFAGGLYPDGANTPPAAYLAKGLAAAKTVQPLNKDGQPDPNGRIGLLAIGMSNACMEFNAFQKKVDADEAKNPRLLVVNCAWPGVETTRMKNPQDAYWTIGLDNLMNKAGISNPQVQVIWLKQATGYETRPFPDDAKGFKDDMNTIIGMLVARFPNLKIIYISCRTYGGYASIALSPEPGAYDSAFGVKWLIEERIQKPANGPWIAWGPYLWTDGVRGRSDKLVWNREDASPNDGIHPSPSGCEKVANLLLQFFKTDETAKGWFLK